LAEQHAVVVALFEADGVLTEEIECGYELHSSVVAW
jgi:hypothetical protein